MVSICRENKWNYYLIDRKNCVYRITDNLAFLDEKLQLNSHQNNSIYSENIFDGELCID